MPRFVLPLFLLAVIPACSTSEPSSNDSSAEQQVDSPTDESTGDSESDNQTWQDELRAMQQALTLSDDEAQQLTDAFQAREQAHSSWMAEHGAELEGLEKKMMSAAKSRDLSGVRAAKAKATPLRDELRQLLKQHKQSIRQSLSDDNQLAWDAHQLSASLLEMCESLQLSDQQVTDIRAHALTAAAASAGQPNPFAAGSVALEKHTARQILTPEQKPQFEALRKKNVFRTLSR